MKNQLLFLLIVCSITGQAQQRFYPYSDGGKWGLTNANLEVLTAPRFDTAFYFYDNYSIVRQNKKFGVIDTNSKIILPIIYDDVLNNFANTFGTTTPIFAINKGGKYGFYNIKSHKPITGFLFDKVEACKENVFIVKQSLKKGLLNAYTGKITNKIIYDDIEYLNDFSHLAKLRIGSKYGVVNWKTGAILLPVKYDQIETKYTDENSELVTLLVATVLNNTAYFIQDKEKIKRFNVENLNLFDGDIHIAEIREAQANENIFIYNKGNGDWKVTKENIGTDSTTIVKSSVLKGYDSLELIAYYSYTQIQEATIKAIKNGKTGIIDFDGNILVPFKYDDITKHSPYYKTMLNNKVGILNSELEVIVSPVLKNILPSGNEYYGWLVEMPNGQIGHIDTTTGKFIFQELNIKIKIIQYTSPPKLVYTVIYNKIELVCYP